jgi:aspartyl-tRNA(Asn)/glutamyl-tRNA(Gln) amidotransferase subunit C
MPRITRAEVLHVAKLARLSLSDDEVERLTGELEAILDHAARIEALDTEGVAPTSHPIPIANVWREDVAAPSLTPDEALANAPHTVDGLFSVPPARGTE